MDKDDARIHHVSDTALWVATYRAEETERPDALFKDPLAAVLIGERGRRIARAMPRTGIMRWVLVVRTVAIDRLIEMALAQGVDLIVNLGTGLDTRPYRMKLPPELRWVEVDFQHTIDLKNEKLRDQTPVCRLERIPLDLADGGRRRELFARLGSEAAKILVITEGVIPYLTNEHAGILADELHAIPAFRYWIQDYFSAGNRGRFMGMRKKLAAAPLVFNPGGDWIGFFEKHGWRAKEVISTIEEAKRIGRMPPLMILWAIRSLFMSREARRKAGRMFGYVLLERE